MAATSSCSHTSPLILLFLVLALSLLAPVHSLTSNNPPFGINCLGSSQCSFTTVNSPNILVRFNDTAHRGSSPDNDPNPWLPGEALPDRELFFDSEHILCAENKLKGSVCLFLQGDAVPENGVPGYIVKRRLSELVWHGCKFCGSVPVSGNNHPFDAGVLTSNYVVDKGCQGVCVQPRRRFFLPLGQNWTYVVGGRNGAGRDGNRTRGGGTVECFGGLC